MAINIFTNILDELDYWYSLGFRTRHQVTDKIKNGTFGYQEPLVMHFVQVTDLSDKVIFSVEKETFSESLSEVVKWLDQNKEALLKESLPELYNIFKFIDEYGDHSVQSYESEAQMRAFIHIMDKYQADFDYSFDACIISKIN